MDRAAFSRAAAELGLELSKAQFDAFEAFEDALYRANEVMNLTRVPKDECWLRHFVDSLLLAPFLQFVNRHSSFVNLLDLGTGPGFPAWPLACALPELRVTALDSSGKMLGFLRSQPLPNLSIIQVRAEEWGVREAFDFVTGRALAPLPIQLELSAAPCRVGGVVVPMRTPSDEPSFRTLAAKELGLELERVEKKALPGTDVVRVFPVFRKLRPTPERYPRRWVEMRGQPL